MADAARVLARASVRQGFRDAPRHVRERYCDFLIDGLAVMAAGATDQSITAMRRAFVATGGSGQATALGFATGTSAATAAFVNGAAMTVLQLQDGHRLARGHPMSHVLPAALALAEECRATPDAFLDAVMAGYEVAARVGASLGGMQPLLHDTGSFGMVGAAVAAAWLLCASDNQRADLIERAIGNAAALALMPFRNTCMEGASAHHLYIATGVQNGIQAARAACAGIAPSPETIERFFGPRAGADFQRELLVAGTDAESGWLIHEIQNAYLKWHPVCAHLAPMLDCIAALRAMAEMPNLPAIRTVEVTTYATALEYDAPEPHSSLGARFASRQRWHCPTAHCGMTAFLPKIGTGQRSRRLPAASSLARRPNLMMPIPLRAPRALPSISRTGHADLPASIFQRAMAPRRCIFTKCAAKPLIC